MRTGTIGALTAALAIALAGVAHGKANTARISISGPGIESEIASSDPELIMANAWAGNFAEASQVASAPDASLPRHLVKFYIDTGESGMRLVYAVHFVWDPTARRARVQLPGPGDRWYRLNIGTIIHDGSDGSPLRDGSWYYANEEWARAVRALLPSG